MLASALVEKCLARYGLTGTVLASVPGERLEGLHFRHPLADVDRATTAPRRSTSPTTRPRKTAPASSTRRPPTASTTSTRAAPTAWRSTTSSIRSRATASTTDALPLFGGLHIWKAQPAIVDALRDAGRLLASSTLVHSYPHCWRHKTPVVYRAAAQWFVRMDEPDDATRGVFAIDPAPQTLRECALDAIDATAFYPENGRARLHDMIAHRPDWCISRQRNWGVPLPFFLHKVSGELHPDTLALIDRAAAIVAEGGVEAWSRLTAEEVLGAEGERSAAHYAKSNDILDVWFDSGSTFFHVLRGSHPGTTSPDDDGRKPEADLYLEGHDQHRGWFHSSLLIACAIEGHAPYRGLLTHGFTVDGSGRKMSKSLGNFVALHEVTAKLGAEIIRLWCASTDYSGDLAIDDKILARVVDAYRRIRNTLRFLLANTSDFDPSTDAVALADMLEIDRWALARTAALQAEIVGRIDPRARRLQRRPLRRLRVPSGRRQAAGVLLGRPRRVLPRHPEGPPLHDGDGVARAPLGADRALAHRPRDAALDGALPELHRRGGVEGVRPEGLAVDLRRGLQRRARVGTTRRCSRKWARIARRARGVEHARSRRCAPRASSARRCRPRSTIKAGPATQRSARHPRRRPALRPDHLGGARRAARRRGRRQRVLRRARRSRARPSASAAGTTAPTSAPIRRIRRSAAAAPPTCSAPASRARVA